MGETFIIDAELVEPVVTYGDGLHLDGPLSFAAFSVLSQDEQRKVPPLSGDWAVDFELPLDRWEHDCDLPPTADPRLTIDGVLKQTRRGTRGIVWGWCCSAAVPVGQILETSHSLRKRPAIGEMVKYGTERRYESGCGPHKAKDLVYPAIHVRKLRWYCRGDAETTLEMLTRYVPSVGKLSRQGPGRVRKWTMKKVDVDWSIRNQEGLPMRRLPALMFPEHPVLDGTIRTPYYHRSRWAETVVPRAWA